LVLTGDQHHYARYSPEPAEPAAASQPESGAEPELGAEPEFAPELVTCGGGGAFLASTHHLPDTLTPAWQPWPTGSGSTGRYGLTTSYPDRARSERLIAFPRFLAACWRNGLSLPLFLGAVDFVLTLALLLSRPALFWAATVIVAGLLGVYAASGTEQLRPRWRRRAAITALLLCHTAAHAGTALLVSSLLLRYGPLWPRVLDYFVAFALSAVLGTVVFVSYLRVADWWGSHTLEAFSGLRFSGYKSHLRLRVSDEGVRVYVLGMDEVPAARRARDLGGHLPRPCLVDQFWVSARTGSR
jgi:hypothetical protein